MIFTLGLQHSSGIIDELISIISCFENPNTQSVFAVIYRFSFIINITQALWYICGNTNQLLLAPIQ
jgi:hypothetical protein